MQDYSSFYLHVFSCINIYGIIYVNSIDINIHDWKTFKKLMIRTNISGF